MKKLLNSGYVLIMLSIMIAGTGCFKSKTASGSAPVEEPSKYELSTEAFPNPERGFIKMMGVKSGGQGLTTAQLNLLRGQNVTMILRLYYFDAYKDKPLDEAELKLIEDDFGIIREAGLKTILRFAYTDDMNGTDAPLNIIEQHLDQLKPIFERNKDVIAFVQAGLIGAWGEWHSSSNGLATPQNRKAILEKWLSVLPKEIMVQVRTPGFKQEIFGTTTAITKEEALAGVDKARVGHHNDCFLASTDDYGTYSNIEAEKEYISKEALYVPTGGETCPPTGGFDPNCTTSGNEMKRLKWTYLNLDWYVPTITAWKNSGCFDEFERNLGYRLALANGSIPDKADQNGELKIVLTVNNRGYAPVYHKKNVSLVLKNKTSGEYFDKMLSADVRNCKPAAELEINESVSLSGIPSGEYELFLKIADQSESLGQRMQYSIRLANKDLWVEDHGGMNSLNQQLTIN